LRWATFDCYGTLIDWNTGIRAELVRLFGEEGGGRALLSYHELEPLVQREHPEWTYREVMSAVLLRLGDEEERELGGDDRDALGRSLPDWPVFPEVPDALREARERGWSLAILSNSDPDFIEASTKSIGVPFELAVVASEIGSYKPAPGHWESFYERTGADPRSHVHVAASQYHDIRPARDLEIACIWINRLGEQGQVSPTRELHDLTDLPRVLDELVPGA
jgi:2-haloacid dehalogenase